MALQDQLVELAITGGVNQKNSQVLTTVPTYVMNRAYRKTGELQRRYGYNCIAPYNLRGAQGASTTPPPTPDKLGVLGNELLRFGGGQLDSYELVSSISTDWVLKGSLPQAVVTRETLTAAPAAGGITGPADLGIVNGTIVMAYTFAQGSTNQVRAEVKDATNGNKLAPTFAIATSVTDSYDSVQVYVFGNYVTVFFVDTTTATLYACSWDSVGHAWGTTNAVQTGVNQFPHQSGPSYAIAPTSTTTFAAVWSRSATVVTNPIACAKYSFSAGTIALVGTGGNFGGTDDPTALQLVAGSTELCLAYGTNASPPTITVLAMAFSNLAQSSQASVTPPSGTARISKLWIRPTGAGTYDVGPSATLDRCFVMSYTTASGGLLGTVLTLRDTIWVSKPFAAGAFPASVYAMACTIHSVVSNQFLVDVSLAPGYVACSFAPTQTLPGTVSKMTKIMTTPVMRATGDWLVSTGISGQGNSSLVNVGARFRFDRNTYNTHAQVNGVLLIGGGVPSIYDGVSVAEASFCSYPDTAKVGTLTAGAGGSMSTGSYGYQFVFVRQDAAGNIYRSAPSGAVTVSVTSGQQVNGKVPYLRLSNAPVIVVSGVSQPVIGVEMYRTVANGSTYFYVQTFANDALADPASFTDGTDDVTISTNAQLYTGGGELPNTTLPCAAQVYAYKSGVFLAGTDDDSLWIGKSLIVGVGPSFTASLTIPPFGTEPISALFSVDSELIVAKPSSLSYLLGDAPAPNGTTNIGNPQPISSAIGCLDPWSVVPYADGVAFWSDAGLVQLDRALAVTRFGKPVEDTLAPVTQFAGAFFVRTLDTLRFAMRGTPGTGNIVALDLYQSTLAQAPVWTVDTVYDVAGAAAGDIRGSCIWKDQYVWISAGGHVYVEAPGTFLDVSGGTSRWIDTHVRTGAEKAHGPQSYQRVRRVGVLGQRLSSHGMAITAITDRGSGTYSWTDADVSSFSNLPNERFRCHLASPPQKSSRIYIDIVDTQPTFSAIGTGEGFTLQSIALEVALKPGLQRVGSSHKR